MMFIAEHHELLMSLILVTREWKCLTKKSLLIHVFLYIEPVVMFILNIMNC